MAKQRNKSFFVEIVFLLSALLILFFTLAYNQLIETILLLKYSPDYFLYIDTFATVFSFALCVIVVAVLIALYHEGEAKKNTVIISGVIATIILIITVICSSNVWTFNENDISYNTFFEKNKIVYKYEDIDNAKLDCKIGVRIDELTYSLNMNDSEVIEIDVAHAFYKSEDNLLDFDKAIADKRKVVGDYMTFGNKSDEFNDYYNSVFSNE